MLGTIRKTRIERGTCLGILGGYLIIMTHMSATFNNMDKLGMISM